MAMLLGLLQAFDPSVRGKWHPIRDGTVHPPESDRVHFSTRGNEAETSGDGLSCGDESSFQMSNLECNKHTLRSLS